MTRNIDIGLLRAFVAAVEQGGIGAAARRLNLTQAAVSQQIGRLESLTGARLLLRDHRGARPTSDGHRLLGRARQLVELNDALFAEMAGLATPPAIRLGAASDICGSYLPSVLKVLTADAQHLDISILSAPSVAVRAALEDGRIDVALIQQDDTDATGRVLYVEPLVWVGAIGGSAHLRRPLPVILNGPTCNFRRPTAAALDASGLRWRPTDTGSADSQIAAVRADMGVTALQPSLLVEGLRILRRADLPSLPSLATSLHLSARPTAVVEAFAGRLIGAVMDHRHRAEAA